MSYCATIGLEIHVELDTNSKMFCSCFNESREKRANFNICPVCLGHPGSLPVVNEAALRKVLKVGLALNCDIASETYFDRKNYFYPDLPKGYQISQHFAPLCRKGFLKIGDKIVNLREIHLEEDTCRLIHSRDEKYSYVDCNRAGVPLMELVTEPDIKNSEQARIFAQELQLLLRYLKVSSADMEKGQMRIEANVSVAPAEEKELGTKVELKNINSFKAVEKAIDYEIKRQSRIIDGGGEVIQQTRGWNDVKARTVVQREKETAFDYRYFPEPDLPLLKIGQSYLDDVKTEIPELPQKKRERFMQEYRLSEEEAALLTLNRELGNYFEKAISELPPRLEDRDLEKMIKLSFNYLTTDLLGLFCGKEFSEKGLMITPENFAELIEMIFKEEISSRIAKKILKEMFKSGKDPSHLLEEKDLGQINAKEEVKKIAEQVIEANKNAVQDFNSGKENALQFLIGQIMARSKGKANPQIAETVLKELLE